MEELECHELHLGGEITYHSSFYRGLHGDLRIWVNSEASVDDAVGDLIAELVGVSLADRL